MKEVNRFEQICQFLEKVRQSRKHLIVGIDAITLVTGPFFYIPSPRE